MADDSDFAYVPPNQRNAFGPALGVNPSVAAALQQYLSAPQPDRDVTRRPYNPNPAAPTSDQPTTDWIPQPIPSSRYIYATPKRRET